METLTLDPTIDVAKARAEFAEYMRDGWFNPQATFADYLALLQERAEAKRRAQELGLKGCDGPELTAEDERILDRVWAQLAAQQRIKEAA